ncbi:L-rhamnose isomerase [Acutalibacter intestini]|uniref:L-rhamnose isomerase n=1 Tax=Acutalibacter intestini TaxID=3093659 RepID=UPI002AC975D8|nr:L-rhamnose isomerase [Acutalibacter sp. M00204]
MTDRYQYAKGQYAAWGVDTDAALERLKNIPISIHCWQGDDVTGLEGQGQALSGGIQTTGNYPGRARNFHELTADFAKTLSLVPGKKRINLHASYAVFEPGEAVDRDRIEPKHFAKWVEFAQAQGVGIDFNPTFFSHPMVTDNLTLSSPDERVRSFWVEHGRRCRRIAAYFAQALNTHCLCNVWIPDGYKDIPADRLGPRLRLKKSLDEIFEEKLPGVIDCVESKVFGIGMESYTVGSAEFYLSYAASHPGVYDLLDNGHYHPTETVSDKIPSLLAFFDKVPLHVTRPVRWDSDHVVLFEDEVKEIAKEIVRNGAEDRVLIGLDYFDASINRVAAWALGARNMQKALLYALLQPAENMKALQDKSDFTRLLLEGEELKTLPFGDVWERYCQEQGAPTGKEFLEEINRYETAVTSRR